MPQQEQEQEQEQQGGLEQEQRGVLEEERREGHQAVLVREACVRFWGDSLRFSVALFLKYWVSKYIVCGLMLKYPEGLFFLWRKKRVECHCGR